MSTSHRTARSRLAVAGMTAALAVAGSTGLLSSPASAAPAPTAGPSNRSSATASRSLDQAQHLATAGAVPDDAASVVAGTSGRHPRVRTSTAAASATVLGSSLARGQQLDPGDALRSPNGRWSVVMGADGVLSYQQAPNRFSAAPVARSLLGPDAAAPVPGSFLALQGDGNLVDYCAGVPVFSTGTRAGTGQVFGPMGENGNFVLFRASADSDELAVLFQTRTGRYPGSRLTVQGDANVVVYTPAGRAVYYTRR